MKRIKKSLIAILALIGTILITGCEKNEPQEPVYGPPPSSMQDEM